MKIKELFKKPVDRNIDGVIKADDARHLQTEVDEYIITDEISKGLERFAECYLGESHSNGVWISGFFGSGKSHLLKILSLLLEGKKLSGGKDASQIILPKMSDEIAKGALKRACAIPSQSILFNIDQKADQIGGDNSSPILEVFVKVLNEAQGYYSKQGYIAEFERNLDEHGKLESFKKTYAKVSGESWEKHLPYIHITENENFAKAYAAHSGKSVEEGLKVLDRLQAGYKVSIESFAQRVKAHIDKQGPDFRLNFFIDEVGQFIGQESKLMLNLQTVAESLSTVCKGRAWVFVTSQGDLQSVIGDLRAAQGQDFTKIAARFKTRVTMTSADVREVIQKRLLDKKEPEPEVLTKIYDLEKPNLQTLYRFADGSIDYKVWRGSDEFCSYYPFPTYQFELFQRAIERLSQHNAFTGRHTAVGERSMLAVFQDVAKGISGMEVGQLATFDLMFGGISASIQGQLQTAIIQAEKRLDNPLAVRILKALFLLKWVREFKATPRNIAILMIDKPNIDIQKHEKAVKEALNLLESDSYLQRNGDLYEFLTNAEKDIEMEIRSTEVDESALTALLGDIIFKDILRDPKFRYEDNGQDYSYSRRLDDALIGREADISINIITPDHPNYGNVNVLAAQNTGKSEILSVLPADDKLIAEARLFLKTNKYIQQSTGAGLDDSKRAILSERGQQNSARRSALNTRAAELLGKAPLYLNGSKLDAVSEGEPRNRFSKAAQALIRFAFPNLKMLKGIYTEELIRRTLLDPDDTLPGMLPSEAETEILTYVTRNQNQGERVTAEEIIKNFSKRPYGWYPLATLGLVARLFRSGKVELRSGNELLDARSAYESLKNSNQHGSVRVRLQEQFDAAKITALKRFHQDFFDLPNTATDARSAAQLTLDKMSEESRALKSLVGQAAQYPFLKALDPIETRAAGLAQKDYAYFISHVADFREEFLEAKSAVLDPIKAFMKGPQRRAYDEAIQFHLTQAANFSEVAEADLAPIKALKASEKPYLGTVIPDAKTAVTRVQKIIDDKLDAEKKTAIKSIMGHAAQLKALPDFAKLSPEMKIQVLDRSETAEREISATQFISMVRDRQNRYTNQDYPAQLALVTHLAVPAGEEPKPGETPAPNPEYIPASSLKADCGLPYISTEEELARWIEALRKVASLEIKKGKRISL